MKHDADRAVPHLQPIYHERMAAFQELGEEWSDKPVCSIEYWVELPLNHPRQNDILQLVLDRGIPKGESIDTIAQRMLILNFTAIHTSSHVSVATEVLLRT